jgi:hypothetical protein
MVRTKGATSSAGGNNTTEASSSAGRKRGREPEIHDSCKCAVCFKVLLEPVTLECGHTLDKRCLHLLVAHRAAHCCTVAVTWRHGGVGGVTCPTCIMDLPDHLPDVNLQLRDKVQLKYPQEVVSTPSPGTGGLQWQPGAA